jgi:esterase/lipase superfamily enzyme
MMRSSLRPLTLLLIIIIGVLGACSTSHLQMTTPVIYHDQGEAGTVDPFAEMPAADRTTSFEVFYATDRRAAKPGASGPDYGDVSDGVMHVGTADVRIGGGADWTQVAAISTSGALLDPGFVEVIDTTEYGVLPSTWFVGNPRRNAPSSEAQAFAAAIDARLERSGHPEITIFVPGYKVDFEFPIRKGVELWHFMGRRGALAAFAWTTRQGMFDYTPDLELAAVSVRNLRRLVEFLAANTSAQRIHLVSHSAGTRILSEALMQLVIGHADEELSTLRQRLRIGQVVFIGSDMPYRVFAALVGDGMDQVAEQMTIYVSGTDSALDASKWLLEWSRLGAMRAEDLTEDARTFLAQETPMSIVDVTAAAGAAAGNGHWYFTSSPWVAADLMLILRNGSTPAERGLQRDPNGPFWVFPEDYPQRIRAIVAERRAITRPN